MRTAHLAPALLVALVMAACTINVYQDGSGPVGQAEGSGAAGQEANTGEVTVAGAATGVEGEAIEQIFDEHVNAAQSEFTARYAGSDAFETNILIQIEGGTPPDLAFFPQPGAVVEQAELGNAIALEDLGFDIAGLEERYGEYLVSLGEYDGKHYGIPDTINYKSAVWYSPPAFEAAGYETPETWDELIDLSDQIVADGKNPWCIGTGSDAATGWPATDWMEDIVLRSAGTDAYDRWAAGDLAFASPEITAAAERFGEIAFTEGYVFGGHETITSTDFRDAPDPLFQDDPPCYLHRQATFITTFFPAEGADGEPLEPFEDYDFFQFPTINGKDGSLMAGGMIAVFNNRPEITNFIDLYTSRGAQCAYGAIDGISTIAAHLDAGPECYDNELLAQAVEPLVGALNEGTARFDASDLMPPQVGSGAFWTGMNDYTNDGPDNLDQVLAGIDAAWPDS